jgi:hypothetical protein
MKFEDYFLDFKKINRLNKQDRETIHGYYRDMIYNAQDGREVIAQSMFNTLIENKFLISTRDKKIDRIFDGDKAVNN